MAMPPLLDTLPLNTTVVPRAVRPTTFVKGRQLALARLREKAGASGAIGIVGIEFHERPAAPQSDPSVAGRLWTPVEFTAVGTPVWADVSIRPRRLMCAALSGMDVAALMMRGWCPADVLVAATSELWNRARYLSSEAALAGTARNAEYAGLTEVMQRARNVVRSRLQEAARVIGADGLLLPQAIDTRVTASRRIVEASATATAIVRLRSTRMPLGESSRMVINTR
jgi:uncharacterized protein YbjQ (UPF0145 family)